MTLKQQPFRFDKVLKYEEQAQTVLEMQLLTRKNAVKRLRDQLAEFQNQLQRMIEAYRMSLKDQAAVVIGSAPAIQAAQDRISDLEEQLVQAETHSREAQHQLIEQNKKVEKFYMLRDQHRNEQAVRFRRDEKIALGELIDRRSTTENEDSVNEPGGQPDG